MTVRLGITINGDGKVKEHRDALEQIKLAAEQHPCFIGYEEDGITREIIDAEGGDAAFVTLDIAWVAKEALDA